MRKFFDPGVETPAGGGAANVPADFELELSDGRKITAADIKQAKFKAAGAERSLRGEELHQYASKGFGAEERFRQVAEKEKTIEQELSKYKEREAMLEAVKKNPGDPLALRRFAEAYGLQEDYERMFEGQPEEEVQPAPKGRQQVAQAPKLTPEQLAAVLPTEVLEVMQLQRELKAAGTDMKTLLKGMRSDQINTTLDKARKNLYSAIDNDDILGTINDEAIKEDAYDRFERRVAAGQTREVATKAVIAEMRKVAGVIEKRLTEMLPSPGMFGAAPTAGGGSRLTPPKMPDVNDPKYKGQEDNVAFLTDLLTAQRYQQSRQGQ